MVEGWPVADPEAAAGADENSDAITPVFSELLVGASGLFSVHWGLVENNRQGGKWSGRGI